MSDALIDAIDAHDTDRVAKLLAEGEDPNEPFKHPDSFPPLATAVANLTPVGERRPGGPIDSVVLLLRAGAEVNAWDARNMLTALLTAAQHNHLEAVRLLLARGADPNVRDDEGETPLRHSAKNGSLEMARLLLLCGGDVYRSGGADGMNPLSLAARRLNIPMVRLFLDHGADPNVPDNDGMTVFDRLRRFPYIAEPETPEKLERFREIRRLLGFPEP